MSVSATMKIGQTLAYTITCADAYGVAAPGQTISTYSSAPAIAMVTNNSFVVGSDNTVANQVITAIANGTAIITTAITTIGGTLLNEIDLTVDSPEPTVINIILGQPTP